MNYRDELFQKYAEEYGRELKEGFGAVHETVASSMVTFMVCVLSWLTLIIVWVF